MKPLIFSLFDNETMANTIKKECDYEAGEIIFKQFPDKETYIKINSEVKDRKIIFIANLVHPDNKILPLLFAAKTARDLGAKEIGLIAPYLVYMRQDKQFNPGEGITSKYFSSLLSYYFDWIMTIDPHLHRFHSLDEIYTIPSFVLHAIDPIVNWLKQHVNNPFIIGPDQESEQWVANIAKKAGAPFIILNKIRKGDRVVKVSIPEIEQYKNYTPILIDDIISTGRTMIETIKHLQSLQTHLPICIGVHAVFSDNAYEDLLKAGAGKIVTCNTIKHISNDIDVSNLIIDSLTKMQNNEKFFNK